MPRDAARQAELNVHASLVWLRPEAPQPLSVETEVAVPRDAARQAELNVHASLAEFRVFGEWFQTSMSVVRDAMIEALKAAGAEAIDPQAGPLRSAELRSHQIRYQLELTPDDNDTFLVTCPDLPEVTTFGDDEASAYANGAAAVAEAVAARLADFSDIPSPAAGEEGAALDTQLSLKVQLKWTMEAAGVTRAELVRRLGVHRPQVDRLFDPNHATRLDQYDQAFAALGKAVDVRIMEAA